MKGVTVLAALVLVLALPIPSANLVSAQAMEHEYLYFSSAADVVSSRRIHVTRTTNVKNLATDLLGQLSWSVWSPRGTTNVTDVRDSVGDLRYEYLTSSPIPAQLFQSSTVTFFFRRSLKTGENYTFVWEYDIDLLTDNLSWNEDPKTTTIFRQLDVSITVPEHFKVSSTEPANATRILVGTREAVKVSATNVKRFGTSGLSVFWSAVSTQPMSITESSENIEITTTNPVAAPTPGVLEVAGLMSLILIASVILIKRKEIIASSKKKEVPSATTQVQPGPTIPTGYEDLDEVLGGGLPEGYAILILSASWDERDLIIRRIIGSTIASGKPVFYVSSDVSMTRELLEIHTKHFYALSFLADKMSAKYGNLFKLPDTGNLSEFNISLSDRIRETQVQTDVSKLIIIEILSDILLRHKSSTTLRWLHDFLVRRKLEKFTILATLSPLIASREDIQPIIDLFDGVIEIYERVLGDRAKRFAVIKKMHGRKYLDKDLILDRDKLF